ncbi:Jhe, partial [Drosophila busckii]
QLKMPPIALTLLLLLLLQLGLSSSAPPQELLLCSADLGCLQGSYMAGHQIERFAAFMGIPYAEPPVGNLRFMNPVPASKLSGIHNASYARMDCIQKNFLMPIPSVYGVEDCLYLNVYRPAELNDAKLPVMVYIHGGGFFSGSAHPLVTGPEFLMEEQIVLVTLSYRLGALGFLSTHDAAISGNFGLKDQRLALRWVQQHIELFGGDAQRVTIFGQSAGGVATHLHMLTTQTEQLFQHVISMSGTANVPFAINPLPLLQTRKVAELCHVKNAQSLSTKQLAQALREVDVETLMNAGDGLKFWHVHHMTNYRPVVERGGQDAFLRQHPKQLIAQADYKKLPLLLGTVPQEGAVAVVNIMENELLRADFNANFDELLEMLLEFPAYVTAAARKQRLELIIEKYFNKQHELNGSTSKAFMNLITDRGFKQPLYKFLWDYVKSVDTQQHPLYMYSFNFKGSRSYAELYTAQNVTGKYNVVHCDDLLYLFNSPLYFPQRVYDKVELQVIKALVQYFVHFAKFGAPLGHDSLSACTAAVLKSRTKGICDYHMFRNAPGSEQGFQLTVEQAYRVKSARFIGSMVSES